MKKLLLLITFIIAFAFPALAVTSKPIPQYHWTYHSLQILSARELIKERVITGKSQYRPEQVVTMIISAMEKIESDPAKIGEDELSSIRQLVNGYKTELKQEGYDTDNIKVRVENCALRAGLPAVETMSAPYEIPRPLSFNAASSVNKFTFSLYKYYAQQNRGNNLFLSPYSVSSALSMTYAGAKGATEAEIGKVLFIDRSIHRSMAALINDINSAPTETAKVSTANAIWPAKQEKLLNGFIGIIKNYYSGSLNRINYIAGPEKARKTINNWVEKHTEEKIKDLIPEGVLTKDTPMVLTNAVYFKSDWLDKFEAHDSLVMPFWIDKEKSIPTIMMKRTGENVKYLRTEMAEIVELPYKDNLFSMLLILPDKQTDIVEIEKNLTHSALTEWTSLLSGKKIRLTIPKFKMEQSFELKKALIEMGMPSAFETQSADFSGINGKHNMYIGNVIHKTFVEVSEEGTEAAAASAVIMMKTSMPVDQKDIVEFKADRPFIFMIIENKTGAILFIGHYSHP